MTIKPLKALGVTRGFSWFYLLGATMVMLVATPAGAVDSCSLTGVYMVSAAIDAPPGDQFLGTFTFTPPGNCAQAGTVSVAGNVMVLGQALPTPVPPTSAPYTVDSFGVLVISPMPGQAIMGRLGHLVGGIAQSIVFIAQPSDARFVGVAVKQDLPGSGATVVTGTPVSSVGAIAGPSVVGASVAGCTSPKVVLGGGALVSSSVPADAAKVAVLSSFPQSATAWSASAVTIGAGFNPSTVVSVTAFAICGNP